MKVLIADDDLNDRKMLEAALSMWDYEVVSASDGKEAWDILQEDDAPRIAVLDWIMPNINGVELCKKIKEREKAPYIFVILLTCRREKEEIVIGLDAGADDFITKPFDPGELKSRIMAGIRVLDYESKIITMAEKRIDMEKALLRTQKLESISILARGLAHDFNNLLTSILARVSIMKKCVNPEEEIYEDVESIEKGSKQARDLVRKFNTFAKAEASDKKTTSIVKLINDTCTQTISDTKIKCDFSIPDDLWPVEVNPQQMSQVISNVVANACESMPEGGTVRVGLENFAINKDHNLPVKEGKYLRVSIKDSGRGIAKEQIGRIFDPYFTTKELGNQKGMGFGLATSYSIVQNHKGLIAVESEPEDGTTFYIYLPAQS